MNLKPQWLAPFLPPPPCPQLCPYFYISIYYIILKLFMYLLLLETISHSSLNVLLIYKIHWRIVKTWTLNDNHNRMKLESLQHKESSGKKKILDASAFRQFIFCQSIHSTFPNKHTHTFLSSFTCSLENPMDDILPDNQQLLITNVQAMATGNKLIKNCPRACPATLGQSTSLTCLPRMHSIMRT